MENIRLCKVCGVGSDINKFKMKNNMINVFTAVALSCTSLVAVAIDTSSNHLQLVSNESSDMKNIISDTSTTAVIKKKFLADDERSIQRLIDPACPTLITH